MTFTTSTPDEVADDSHVTRSELSADLAAVMSRFERYETELAEMREQLGAIEEMLTTMGTLCHALASAADRLRAAS